MGLVDGWMDGEGGSWLYRLVVGFCLEILGKCELSEIICLEEFFVVVFIRYNVVSLMDVVILCIAPTVVFCS